MSGQGPYSKGGYIPSPPHCVHVGLGEVAIDAHGLAYVLTRDGWQLHGMVDLDAVTRSVTEEDDL